MLRILQPHALPRLSGIDRFVNAVAEVRAALAVVLARPNHRTLEYLGSMTTQQLLNAPPSSKIGVNVTPRLTVFHKPPNADATYQTLVLFGSIRMSAMRPVTRPGPIERI